MLETLLPLTFAFLMGVSIVVYVVLDGFDLGTGLLFPLARERDKDRMMGAIGPFWDANETWLVLAGGILLVAFPFAHGKILTALYIPVTIMLFGLILRGVAFEFRAKSAPIDKPKWDDIFFAGSLITSLSQGYMLGVYVLGLRQDWVGIAFGLLVAICLAATYLTLGAAWLIYKCEEELQKSAVRWTRIGLVAVILGLIVVSIASPLASPRIFDKWFLFPNFLILMPLPIVCGIIIVWLNWIMRELPAPYDQRSLSPFLALSAIICLGFCGLAYSFYPYVIPEKMTIYEAAAAPEALIIILAGTLFVLPVIVGYSIYAYRVFGGKATDLSYD